MKKILSLVFLAIIGLFLVGCENVALILSTSATETTQNNNQTTTLPDIVTTEKVVTKSPDAEKVDKIELTEGDVYNIHFWHIWGAQKSAVLGTLVSEFCQYMLDTYGVTVNVESTAQSDYGTLLSKTTTAIASGDDSNVPNIVIGYPDHFAAYLKSQKIVSLDKYIDSENYGVDRNDFIKAYMEENNQFDGITYSLPLSKSQEIMVYNKSALDALKITIPYDHPMTWYELYSEWAKIKEYKENYANFKYLINYDSTDNMFINFARQWKAPYTTNDGKLLVTDTRTVEMLTYLEGAFSRGFLSAPINYADTAKYGSEYFQQQQMPFTIGSTAGVSYDVPTATSADVKFVFDACVAMVPQMTIDPNDSEYSMSVVQQGPNIALLDKGTDEDELVSWLLVKYLTSMEQYSPDDADANEEGFIVGQNNSARFGIDTGYFPVTESAYNSSLYKSHMAVGEAYFKNGYTLEGVKMTNPDGTERDVTPKEKANLLSSQVAYIAYLQSGWLRYDPAFAATSTLFGSADIRKHAGECIDKVAKTPTYDAATALRELLEACTIKTN